MREIIRLFTQIALMRRGPQDVPASMLLLVLTIGGYVAVNFILYSALPPVPHWQGQFLVDTVFMLVWYVVLLRLVGRPERTLQTTTAVFGFQAVLSPLGVLSNWLWRQAGADEVWQLLASCALVLLLVWLIAANTRVVRAALEWSATACVVLVILQLVSSYLVMLALFAPGNV